MRASAEQMDIVAVEIVNHLLERGHVSKDQASHAQAVVRATIVLEKEQDEELDREARALLEQHAGPGWRNMDTQMLLQKIKRKLAEEKGIAL